MLADPPWEYRTGGDRNPREHYSTMKWADIENLPVHLLCNANCILFLWCPVPHIQIALRVMAAWGFKYKTMVTWVKMKNSKLQVGTGFRLRGCSEVCLVGTKGKVPKPKSILRSVIMAPRTSHSSKPSQIYEYCEQYEGPYLELFGRPSNRSFDNWTRIGNEITGRDIRDDIEEIKAVK